MQCIAMRKVGRIVRMGTGRIRGGQHERQRGQELFAKACAT